MNVFVVEDSDLLRERLVRSITEVKGVQVSGYAESADEAIASIHQGQPDAVILDIGLRKGTGFQVLAEIKQGGEGPLVIVLTNYADPQHRKKYIEAGADFFFDKSHEFDQVQIVLNQQLAQVIGAPVRS